MKPNDCPGKLNPKPRYDDVYYKGPQKYQGVWRKKGKQSNSYPKLMVNDDVVTGSINIRNTRLPLWAIIGTAINDGWKQVENGWEPEKSYGFTKEDLAGFLYYLLEQRGEFGRLLLTLASVEKLECWWQNNKARNKVMKQLQNCLDALQAESEKTMNIQDVKGAQI